MLYSLALPGILCRQPAQKVIPYFFPADQFLLVEINGKLSARSYVARPFFAVSEMSLKAFFSGVERKLSYLNLC